MFPASPVDQQHLTIVADELESKRSAPGRGRWVGGEAGDTTAAAAAITLIYEVDLYFLKMYLHVKMNFLGHGFRKL